MKKNVLLITVLLITVFGYSQKQIKTIYTVVENMNKWGNQKSNVYTTYNKSGSEKESGTWEYISDLKKYKKTKIKPIKTIDVFNDNKKIISKTTLIEKGLFKGLDQNKTIFYYKKNGELNRKVHYYAQIDTMDLAYEQYNNKRKISPEYIYHDFAKESVEFYENGKIKKRTSFLWFKEGEIFTYNKKGNLTKTDIYDFGNKTIEFIDKNIVKTTTNKYTYDTNGNWIEMKVYDSNNKLISNKTRTIVYY